jgi:hypothetical protein
MYYALSWRTSATYSALIQYENKIIITVCFILEQADIYTEGPIKEEE